MVLRLGFRVIAMFPAPAIPTVEDQPQYFVRMTCGVFAGDRAALRQAKQDNLVQRGSLYHAFQIPRKRAKREFGHVPV